MWTSAVRLLRVDLESPISEKDKEDGYFLFEYPHAGRNYAGSLEVVTLRRKGVSVVRVFVNVAGLPSYVERMMLTRLERKLLAEYGPPQVGLRDQLTGDKGPAELTVEASSQADKPDGASDDGVESDGSKP